MKKDSAGPHPMPEAVEKFLSDRIRSYARKGGQARQAQLTPEERTALARKAGLASGAAARRRARQKPAS